MSKTTDSQVDASVATTTWRLIGTDANGLEYFKRDEFPKCLFITEPSGGRTSQHADPAALLSEGSLVELELHEDTRGSLTGLSHLLRVKGVEAPKRDTLSCVTDDNGDGYIAARWGEKSICFLNRPAVTERSNDNLVARLSPMFPPGTIRASDPDTTFNDQIMGKFLYSDLTEGKIQVFVPTDVHIYDKDIKEGHTDALILRFQKQLQQIEHSLRLPDH